MEPAWDGRAGGRMDARIMPWGATTAAPATTSRCQCMMGWLTPLPHHAPHCCGQAGFFQAAGQLPWELTPVLGLITDAVPLLGYRRKGYLLVVGLVGEGLPTWLIRAAPAPATDPWVQSMHARAQRKGQAPTSAVMAYMT